jgi:lysophospholipase L1-like esterase
LLCELKRKKPSIVLIMYGTNDLERYNNLSTFQTQLTTIAQKSIAAGVIPVLSTIPPRVGYTERVSNYNAVIIAAGPGAAGALVELLAHLPRQCNHQWRA